MGKTGFIASSKFAEGIVSHTPRRQQLHVHHFSKVCENLCAASQRMEPFVRPVRVNMFARKRHRINAVGRAWLM